MQIKEIACSDTNSRYELKEKADGKIELSVDENTVIFEDSQAMADLAQAWSTFNRDTTFSENTTNKLGSKESLIPVNTDFPRKVRNAILIMVAIGVTILIGDGLKYAMWPSIPSYHALA